MRYNGLSYVIGEGFRNTFKNKKSSVISIMTMICTMFLFGLFYAIGVNVNSVLEQVQMKQGIQVFIWDEVTDEQKADLENQIKALDGVNTVVYKNKQEALEDVKSRFKDNQELMAGYEGENNIFPASFVVTLTNLEKLDSIQSDIERIGKNIAAKAVATEETVDLEVEDTTTVHESVVKKITSKDNTINTLITIAKGVRITVGVIFIILLFISITIISNTIRLTVHARRKEISIMKYVGATNSFIRGPFIVEGIIIGILAAMITLLCVGLLYDFIIQKVEASKVLQTMNITLLSFAQMAQMITIIYATLGIGVGIVGSAMSMKKYLEV